jgi:hypothetical protein
MIEFLLDTDLTESIPRKRDEKVMEMPKRRCCEGRGLL